MALISLLLLNETWRILGKERVELGEEMQQCADISSRLLDTGKSG